MKTASDLKKRFKEEVADKLPGGYIPAAVQLKYIEWLQNNLLKAYASSVSEDNIWDILDEHSRSSERHSNFILQEDFDEIAKAIKKVCIMKLFNSKPEQSNLTDRIDYLERQAKHHDNMIGMLSEGNAILADSLRMNYESIGQLKKEIEKLRKNHEFSRL